MRTYGVDYFIHKFESIPEDYIGTTAEATDAWEWCDKEEDADLYYLVHTWGILSDVNDGADYAHLGSTPQQRVVAFLKHIKTHRPYYLY